VPQISTRYVLPYTMFFYNVFYAIIHLNYLYRTLQWLLAGGQRVPLSALFDDTLPWTGAWTAGTIQPGPQQNTRQGGNDHILPDGKVSV